MSITVVQLNLLAPLWIGDVYKQFPCYDAIISPKRLTRTLSYLLEHDADVYVLCEVEERSLRTIKRYFGSNYDIVFTSNKKGFWSEHLEGKEWIENGTCVITSNWIKVQRRMHIDLNDGCMATAVTMSCDGVHIAVVAVHFDTGPRKYIEADVLLGCLDRFADCICVISGDFNMISTMEFEDRGYVCSRLTGEHTTILLEGVIDHTLVRGARRIRSKVLHPVFGGNTGDTPNAVGIAKRLCFNPDGSDHYATISKISL